MNRNNKGLLFILIAALMFGSYGVWSRLIGESFGVFYQGWSRGLLISFVLFPILLFGKQIVPIRKADWKWLSVFLFFTSLTQAPLFYAFNHMDIGTATLLFYVTMMLTMYIVGLLFLGEKLNRIKIISFVLASIGLYIIFSFSIVAFALLAALMAILNGVASGGEVSFSKKLSGSYSPLYLSWLSWLIIAITNAPISFFLGEQQHLPSFEIVWLYQIGYAIASVLGFWLIIKGLKFVEASIGGLLGLLEIVFSILLGIMIFNEGLTEKTIIGGLIIIFAAALPHLVELGRKYPRRANQ